MMKMTQDKPTIFLTNMKLIYQHGVSHSKNNFKIHLLFAIHNCHYVVEQILRQRAKDFSFTGELHKIGFEKIIKRVNKKKNIPYYNDLLELNKIRNPAEHLNIFPDADKVRVYVEIVGKFLKWSYKNYYKVDYESLALEDMIHDVHIKRVMLEAKKHIGKNDLINASNKMYEALGAFKFVSFGFLSDPRIAKIAFDGISLANILADLAFKIIIAQDEPALKKLMAIRTKFTWVKDGQFGVHSVWQGKPFKDKEEAMKDYEDILHIILTYQDKMPLSIWRKK